MDGVTTGIAAVSIGAALLAILGWVWRRNEDQHRRRAELAKRRGWTYERLSSASGELFRLSGTTSDGSAWTLVARRSRNEHSRNHETRWRADVPRVPEAAVAVGPPLPAAVANIDFGGMMAQMLLRAFFGDDAQELAGLEKVEVGPDAFRDKFDTLATDRDVAEQFVSGPTVMALLDYAERQGEPPIVLYWKPGLEVRIRRVVHEPADLVRIVELGLMLHTTVLPA